MPRIQTCMDVISSFKDLRVHCTCPVSRAHDDLGHDIAYPRQHHSPTVAFVHTLPSEILIEIFATVLATLPQPSFERNDVEEAWVLRPRPTPLLFASICRRWRQIAFAQTPFWGHINLSFKRGLEHGYERILLQEWVGRAGEGLLSVYITMPLFPKDSSKTTGQLTKMIRNVANELKQSMHRVKLMYIDVHAAHPTLLRMINRFFSSGMKNLEEVHIVNDNKSQFHFNNCPRLKVIECMPKFTIGSNVNGQESVGSTIRSLKMESSIPEAFQMITGLEELEEAHFTLYAYRRHRNIFLNGDDDERRHGLGFLPISLPRQPYTVSSLTRLSIEFTPTCYHVNPLLDALHLPNLSIFQLCITIDSAKNSLSRMLLSAPWTAVYMLLMRSRPPLQYLSLQLPVMRGNQLVEVLSMKEVQGLEGLMVETCLGEEELQAEGLGAGWQAVTEGFWAALSGDRSLVPGQDELKQDTRGNSGDLERDVGPLIRLERRFMAARRKEDEQKRSTMILPNLQALSIYTPDIAHKLESIARTILARFALPAHRSSSNTLLVPTLKRDVRTLKTIDVYACAFRQYQLEGYVGIQEYLDAGLNIKVNWRRTLSCRYSS